MNLPNESSPSPEELEEELKEARQVAEQNYAARKEALEAEQTRLESLEILPWMKQYSEGYLREGFTRLEAYQRLERIHQACVLILGGDPEITQEKLFERIDISQDGLPKEPKDDIGVAFAVNMLPFLVSEENKYFDFDLEAWIEEVLNSGEPVGHMMMRYFELWESRVTSEKTMVWLDHIKRNDGLSVLSLYFYKLLSFLEDGRYGQGRENYFYKLLREIINQGEDLPLLSFIPLEQLPVPFRKIVHGKLVAQSKPALTGSGIEAEDWPLINDTLVPRVGKVPYSGECSQIEALHEAALRALREPEDIDEHDLGTELSPRPRSVLIFKEINGQVVLLGSMKMDKGPSLLMFRTVKARHPHGRLLREGEALYPAVRGGVYLTDAVLSERCRRAYQVHSLSDSEGPAKIILKEDELFPLRPIRFLHGQKGTPLGVDPEFDQE